MNWYLSVIKRYFDFNGRAHRQEFWMFFLIHIAIVIALMIVGTMLKTGLLSNIYGLAVLLPALGVGARRLHDTGKSGWFQLIGIIPILGLIVLCVFWAQEGQPGDNQYGSNPKGA